MELKKEITRLAKLKGYPHIKLSALQYLDILTQAHKNIYKTS